MPLQRLLRYVAMTPDDTARLVALHPRLEPHFPEIAGAFYDAVWNNPETAGILTGPEQIERLRVTLIDWMSTGLLGPYDDRFYDKRSRIGRRHVQIGLPHEYMFTAMNVVRLAYQDRVMGLYPTDEACDVMRAVHKLLDIELAIMVHHYQLDSDEKLLARERKLQADRMTAMQTMTAGLAHEVRNPLNAAKLQLELLERRLRREINDPRFTEPSELAQFEIDRLTGLIEDFLSFAKPPALHPQDRDVSDVVRQVYQLEKPNADKRGVGFSLMLPETRMMARIDPPKLHQAIDNLVRNALEAVGKDGKVTLALHTDGDELVIVVEDNGPGIPANLHGRIYEPFFTTKEGGTGLGMSIVHSLIGLHGGNISIENASPGARFVVRLPRR